MTTAHDPDDLLNLDNLRAALFYTPQLPRTAGDYADEAASLAARTRSSTAVRCSRFTRKCGARRSSRARARRTSGCAWIGCWYPCAS